MPRTDRSSVLDFVLANLPPPPRAVLEVGAGRGELASSLVERGYRVTAIDPDPPAGPGVDRVAIGDFVPSGTFAAVIASRALHHIVDLDAALDRIVDLLDPGGVIIVHDFAWDRVVGPTARWLFEALQHAPDVRATVGRSFEEWHAAWRDDHAALHGFQRLVDGLDARFTRRSFRWVPYLAAEYVDRRLEPSEPALIEEGAIQASAFRYVALRP